ncbi:hypothetical protein [Streptomyces turgidiscabies]|uniref:hypothetical protein n=1 Tax=Streptomyces turgidiscabies TaxID=85558 RepID=UPI0038F7B06F
MTALTEEDIAAARAQGDLSALLLMASGMSAAAPKQRVKAPPVQVPRAQPGAWPDGSVPPGLLPEVAEHLARLWPDRYRAPEAGAP